MNLPDDIQRLAAKLYLRDPAAIAPHDVVPAFHRFIQTHALDDTLVDVSDYSHVPDGPGAVLVGHGANYSLDDAGRPGFLVSRKRDLAGDAPAKLRAVVAATLRGAQLLEADAALDGKARFSTKELELRFPDRLRAPNTPETVAAWTPVVAALARTLHPTGHVTVAHVGEPRDVFTLLVTSDDDDDLATLLARLG